MTALISMAVVSVVVVIWFAWMKGYDQGWHKGFNDANAMRDRVERSVL